MFPMGSFGPDPRPNRTSFDKTSRTHSHLLLSAAVHGEDDPPWPLSFKADIPMIPLWRRLGEAMDMDTFGLRKSRKGAMDVLWSLPVAS